MTDHEQSARTRADAQHHRRLSKVHDLRARDLEALAGSDDVEVPTLKGSVQRRVVGLPGIFTERGLSAGEIADQLDYDEANVYTVVKSLTDAGMTEQVEGASPRRWRAAIKHRRDRILRMSRLIPEGRWTNYGDFSIAVYDNVRMAITVGQVAAKNAAFANPHRVLWVGGQIKDVWRDDEGRGPEECERRLRAEGIEVTDHRADPDKAIGWQELKALLEADEESDTTDEGA